MLINTLLIFLFIILLLFFISIFSKPTKIRFNKSIDILNEKFNNSDIDKISYNNSDIDKISYNNSDIDKISDNIINILDKKYQSTTYDIVYSINAHENPDSLHNMILNIRKFNKDINILICLNMNVYMYKIFNIDSYNYVIINSNYYDKQLHTHLIMKGHIDNYFYLCNNNIKFKNIMLLASNCLFIKQMILPKETLIYYNDMGQGTTNFDNLNHWHWNLFKENKNIVNLFLDKKISFAGLQHEGILYSYDLCNKICNFIKDNNIFNIIEKELCFEEIIFASIETYFCNGMTVKRYCKVYWENDGYMPTIDNIKSELATSQSIQTEYFLVKRIPRDTNHNLVKYINVELFKSNGTYESEFI